MSMRANIMPEKFFCMQSHNDFETMVRNKTGKLITQDYYQVFLFKLTVGATVLIKSGQNTNFTASLCKY